MVGNDAYGAYLDTLKKSEQKKRQPIIEDNTLFFVFAFVLALVLLWLFL